MSAPAEKGKYEVEPIDGTVNDRKVVLHVPERYFKASTNLISGTTLEDFMSSEDVPKGDAITNGFGSYIYREQLPKTGGNLRFLFLKDKTDAEKLEVVKPAFPIWKPVEWPNVLQSLYAIKAKVKEAERGTTGSTATTNIRSAERFYDRYRLIRGGTFNTEVQVEEFFSPTPVTEFFATEPHPEPVYYNFLGMQNTIEALHEEINIPELEVEISRVEGFGTANAQEIWNLGAKFPATIMTTWEGHYRFLNVTELDGGFYYRREFVLPPPLPPFIEI